MHERPLIPVPPDAGSSTPPTVRKPVQMKPRGTRRQAMRQRQRWFLHVGLLLINVVIVVTLAKVSVPPSRQAFQAPPDTASLRTPGTFQEYPLPQSDSQIMHLTTDSRGRIWFGEMGRNFLAVFDPTPPILSN
jgi:hypothetical protein